VSLPRSSSPILSRRLAATFEAIDELCAELRSAGAREIPEHEHFAVELLLREALSNAVAHACADTADRQVSCEIEALATGVIIRVRDSGTGFDWRRYLHAASGDAAESGRGIHILRRYSSALRFNELGNEVEIIRLFRPGGNHART